MLILFRYFNFIIDASTGKTCCLHYFVEGKFKSGPVKHTVGVEFGTKQVEIGGKLIKLNCWDTAGQERFQSVTRSYYRGASGAIIVYDVSDRKTFEHLRRWIQDAKHLAREDISIVLVGA